MHLHRYPTTAIVNRNLIPFSIDGDFEGIHSGVIDLGLEAVRGSSRIWLDIKNNLIISCIDKDLIEYFEEAWNIGGVPLEKKVEGRATSMIGSSGTW